MLEPTTVYTPSPNRYDSMTYNHAGESGLKLPAISLGFWHNFGDTTPYDTMRRIVFTAFDNGITHFDLANNYGPEPGSAEKNCGRLLHEYFHHHRDGRVCTRSSIVNLLFNWLNERDAPAAASTRASASPTAAQRVCPRWRPPVGLAEMNSRLKVVPFNSSPRP